ncbi:MAG: hypothetical protein QHJ73_08495, partial [Armatimonadota bacterium]|nr:hypothetical protein [Armatimonadota bacterium]
MVSEAPWTTQLEIAHVLFMDVVEYSRLPMEEQTRQLAELQAVVRATEAFTPELPGFERVVVPIYSLMIGTEPLPDAFW